MIVTTGALTDYRALVAQRASEIARFLVWANQREAAGRSTRWCTRHDIQLAAIAGALFPERWWGLVVFSCFGALNGAEAVKDVLPRPMAACEAERILDMIALAPGAIGHHRIQPTHKGAKQALVSACQHAGTFRAILLDGEDDFDERYERLRALKAPQWGRTTCFDLLLRAAALGIAEHPYRPARAYLKGSTGPALGFKNVWGLRVTPQNAAWCERVLAWWSDNWTNVARSVGAAWPAEPYVPADLENALCIYHEHLTRGWVESAPWRAARCDVFPGNGHHTDSSC